MYTVIDIWSRYVVGHLVADTEDGDLAGALIADAAHREGIDPDQLTIHADRGGAMTCKTVRQLLTDLRITRSHSRPKTSNDNPYIEASFKTLKYHPTFPTQFGSLQHARQHCADFYDFYNHEHYHSGIGLHTPASVHHHTAERIRERRQIVLEAAFTAHPERFTRRPKAPELPQQVWINNPNTHGDHQDPRPGGPQAHAAPIAPTTDQPNHHSDRHGRNQPPTSATENKNLSHLT